VFIKQINLIPEFKNNNKESLHSKKKFVLENGKDSFLSESGGR
jgi:hypothetical protein